jgi:hypothetical protein
MPHAVYFAAHVLCPWPGCGYAMRMIDFQLEIHYPALYSQVMASWGRDPHAGLVGKCPGCDQFVLFHADRKVAVTDPRVGSSPVLPDDWPGNAVIIQ